MTVDEELAVQRDPRRAPTSQGPMPATSGEWTHIVLSARIIYKTEANTGEGSEGHCAASRMSLELVDTKVEVAQ